MHIFRTLNRFLPRICEIWLTFTWRLRRRIRVVTPGNRNLLKRLDRTVEQQFNLILISYKCIVVFFRRISYNLTTAAKFSCYLIAQLPTPGNFGIILSLLFAFLTFLPLLLILYCPLVQQWYFVVLGGWKVTMVDVCFYSHKFDPTCEWSFH